MSGLEEDYPTVQDTRCHTCTIPGVVHLLCLFYMITEIEKKIREEQTDRTSRTKTTNKGERIKLDIGVICSISLYKKMATKKTPLDRNC